MITVGLKLTHDGAVALMDDDTLMFSVEIEKVANQSRYSPVSDLAQVVGILEDFGYDPAQVDQWVIDGWDGDRPGQVELLNSGTQLSLTVGPYRESATCPDLLEPSVHDSFTLKGVTCTYMSYQHAAGHVASAYASSPFAASGDASFVLVWDGGLFPRLYWVDPASGITNLGHLFPLIGHAYATAGHHFGPFRRKTQSANVDDLTVAGKLMAYIALGQPSDDILRILSQAYNDRFEGQTPAALGYRQEVGGYGSLVENSMGPLHEFFEAVRTRTEPAGFKDEDVLASVHLFLERLLVDRLRDKIVASQGPGAWNLCFAGGCALNIKWNSALRDLPVVAQMWVPPFPNDSGSAIGAAALALFSERGARSINWNVRLGPRLGAAPASSDEWRSRSCSAQELAEVLATSQEPVAVLNGRAELGPRALGGRSILCSPVRATTKDELNRLKEREHYRPVAPVCLEELAPQIFDPGTPDPFMLFDHEVRENWIRRIPAVVHLDGTARLQTVNRKDDEFLGVVLEEFYKLTGVPVLCNTSANFNGCGFFPDVASAMRWGRVDRIWSNGVMHERCG